MTYRILLVFFFLLTVANLYIFIKRNDGFDYVQQSSYRQLYPNISKGIANIGVDKRDLAIIDLKGFPAPAKWNAACNDSLIVQGQQLPIRFPLKENINRYRLTADDTAVEPIIIDIDFAPGALYKKNGNSVATNYEIRYCNQPFITDDTCSVNNWRCQPLSNDTGELVAIKKIIADLPFKPADSTIRKVKIIGDYIYRAIKNNIGIPADSIQQYSAYRQFCLAREGKAKVWCSNIRDIFTLFASNTGIVCRNIGIAGRRGIFSTGLHSVNECYLPESGEWVYTDITQNILSLTDTSGKMLNTVDVYHLKKLVQAGNIVMYSSGDSAVVKGKYNDADRKYIWAENEILFPHPYDPSELYSLRGKISRYISRQPWLEIYSETTTYSNNKFYLKIYLLYSWFILAVLILSVYIVKLKKSRRN